MQKSQNVRFIGSQIVFGAFMDKDSGHGVIYPAYQVVVVPECFTKSIPADGLELTRSTSGAPLTCKNSKNWQEKMRLENKK